MSGRVLYTYDLDDNCYKVRLGLSLLGLEATRVAVNAFPGREPEKPPFLAINPAGTVPVLAEGTLTLAGAEAILAHLARKSGGAGWLPDAANVFGPTIHWLFFAAGPLAAAHHARLQALFDVPGDETALRADARKALRIMDDHMTARGFAGGAWFAADAPTIADIALFPAFALSRDCGIDHDEFPALRRWARRFRTLPGFVTMPGVPDYH